MDEIFEVGGLLVEHEAPAERAAPVRPAKNSRGGRARTAAIAVTIAVAVGVPGYVVASNLLTRSDSAKAADFVTAGLAAHRAAKVQEATALYLEAIRYDVRNKYAHYNLGLIAQIAGDRAMAEREYRITLALDGLFGGALFNLAIIRTDAGALDEARDLYRQVIALEPRNAGAHLNLGYVLLKLSALSDAKKAFAEAVRLDPQVAARLPKEAR